MGSDGSGARSRTPNATFATSNTTLESVLEKAAAIGEVFWLGCIDVLRRSDEGRHWDDADRLWSSTGRGDELVRVIDSLRRRHILTGRRLRVLPVSRWLPRQRFGPVYSL